MRRHPKIVIIDDMRLEHYPQKKLEKEILEIIKKYMPLEGCRLFFFGSRVVGKGDEHSDIDAGILCQKTISAQQMASIKEDIDNLPILYKLELVDFKNVSDDFRQVALKNIEIFYGKK